MLKVYVFLCMRIDNILQYVTIIMVLPKSGRRLVLLSEGLIPSVYIDKSSLEEILSEGGDCSYVC